MQIRLYDQHGTSTIYVAYRIHMTTDPKNKKFKKTAVFYLVTNLLSSREVDQALNFFTIDLENFETSINNKLYIHGIGNLQ